MSNRKRQKKRKARSRKNKQPAVTPNTDSIPKKPKTPVEEQAQSNSTTKAPPKKDVILDPKSTSKNIDSAKRLLDGEPDDAQFGEVGNMPTDEKQSLVKAANGSNGNGWLQTKKLGRYFITTIEVLAAAFVIPTAFVLIVDLEDRQSQRIAQAWGLVTQHAPGNSGKIEALEYLISDDCEKGLIQEASKWDLFKYCSWLSMLVPPKRKVDLTGIDLSEKTHSSGVFLNGVDLSSGYLSDAKFTGASLHQARMSGAYLENAVFSKAYMHDFNMEGASLYNTKFTEANIQQSDFSKTIMERTDFTGAFFVNSDMTEARAWEAVFSGASMFGNDLSYTDFRGADLRGAGLVGVNFKHTTFNDAFFASHPPYKYVVDRKVLMGWKYELFPWPIDAKSGAAYEIGRQPDISPSLLGHFTEFGDLCTWAPRMLYVECLSSYRFAWISR